MGECAPKGGHWLDSPAVVVVLGVVWLAVGVGLLCTGPFLSTHETIVAQIARQTLQNGNWIVPRYLDAPFLVKPPLSPWLASIAGFLLPAETMSGLPVSTAAARLPSLLATLMTAVVVYSLARSMYGRRIGLCTAFVYATSAGTMAFALNATAEALLAFFCTWAYAEFWWSRQTVGKSKRLHQVLFFVALSLAMFAKAPMPLMVVAVPLAVWWWAERSTRLVADGGLRATGGAVQLFGRDLIARTRLALTDLGVWWGIPVTFALLLGWLWAASRQVPSVWALWHTEYLDRLSDQELWVESHGTFYYLPVLLGFAAPWLLSLPEALASPFLSRYRKHRRPITYAWFWAVVSVLLLSLMHFKQDYYLVPVMPAFALLLGPVLYAMFVAPAPPLSRARVRATIAVVAVAVVAAAITCWLILRNPQAGWHFANSAGPFVVLAVVFVGGIVLATALFLTGRRPGSLVTVGLTAAALFACIWITTGANSGQLRDHAALVSALRRSGVSDSENLYWGESVPDGRVPFYFNRRIRQFFDPFELRAGLRGSDKETVMLSMGAKICKMLEGERVYFLFERERYSMLKSLCRPKCSVFLVVDRSPTGPDKHDWVVVTNK